MPSTIDRDMLPVIEACKAQGWLLVDTQHGTIKAIPPNKDKPIVVFSKKSKDWRSISNNITHLKKSGLVWPTREQRERDIAEPISSIIPPPPPLVVVNTDWEDVVDPPSVLENKRANSSINSSIFRHRDATTLTSLMTATKDIVEKIPEASADRLFKELKEAQEFYRLAAEHEQECAMRASAAQRALDIAKAETEKAAKDRAAKKAAFDKAFGS